MRLLNHHRGANRISAARWQAIDAVDLRDLRWVSAEASLKHKRLTRSGPLTVSDHSARLNRCKRRVRLIAGKANQHPPAGEVGLSLGLVALCVVLSGLQNKR
jgi:hypothetical protein